jgi:predicted RNA methylase
MAPVYIREVDKRFVPVVEHLIGRAELKPGQQVLDLGTGTGSVALRVAPTSAKVHELCAIAGRGDLAAGFIAKATPVAQVRRALLEARAAEDEATAIRSQVRPATVEPTQPAIDTAAIYAARNQNVR